MNNCKIGIVTPMKDEIENIPVLVDSLEKSILPIYLWIIIDNDSVDGSYELIQKKIKSIKSVHNIILVKKSDQTKNYQLGIKYSQIINFGFEQLLKFEQKNNILLDFFGILDADCFPEPTYYLNLVKSFQAIPKMGIASGQIFYHNNKNVKCLEKRPQRWARGGIRLIRRECFSDVGYCIGMSADAIMSAKAWMSGWYSQSFKFCRVLSRQICTRTDYSYVGKSAYFRYVPFYFVIMKALCLLVTGKKMEATKYCRGYFEAKKCFERGKLSPKIKTYFRFLPIRILFENVIVIKNRFCYRKHFKK